MSNFKSLNDWRAKRSYCEDVAMYTWMVNNNPVPFCTVLYSLHADIELENGVHPWACLLPEGISVFLQ